MTENDTRARLLVTARKLFGNKGFRGASVREITASAGANLGAVTYHYGSKANLYAEVMDRLFDQLAARIEQASAADAAPTERMRAVGAAVFGFFTQAPDVPRLIVHQLSLGAPPPEAILRHVRRILAAVERVVQAGQDRGDFRPVEPVLIAFSLISQSVWFALAGSTIGPAVFPGVDRTALARKIENHIADVVTRALAAGSDSP
jgi:AcrR family transcriptional regulator